MVSKKDFKKINDYLWELPKDFREDMNAPARIYASEKILGDVEEKSLEQLVNITTLPSVVEYGLAMPDIHLGYGFPIGGVSATKFPDGVISPGGIGFDENCGMRLLKSEYTEEEIRPYLDKLATKIKDAVPSGLGQGRKKEMGIQEINEILEGGVPKLIEWGYGEEQDALYCEEEGKMEQADSSCVSEKAKNRGKDQVGTLGSGNHFAEVQKVEKIFDEKTAKVFGLEKNQVVVMIHTGSRGFGHQNCTDYLKVAGEATKRYNISVPDKQLASMPFSSPEGQKFFRALSGACNYAWCNRHMIAYYVRKAWAEVLGERASLKLLYDVAHNIAKVEKHYIGGENMKLVVHRKGATRAFPPDHPEIPAEYRGTGQPAILPGSMGTASYVLAGIPQGKESFYTTAHGSGRSMSRHQAIREFSGEKITRNLKKEGILVKCHSMKGIAEEASGAYKDIDNVVETIQGAGLARKVARLTPLAVVKGE